MKKTLLFTFLIFFVGCTQYAYKKGQTQLKIDERLGELVSAAKISNQETKLQIENIKNKLSLTNNFPISYHIRKGERSSEITDNFLTRGLKLTGLPARSQNQSVSNLLSTNIVVRTEEQENQRTRTKQETEWQVELEELKNKLLAYGSEFEEERNEKIKFWTKFGIGALLVIGVPIALMVLFPPLASGLIGLFPSLIKIIGLVPKSTVERTVKGISQIRAGLKHERDNGGQNNQRKPIDILNLIDTTLLKSTDEKDRRIIEKLRRRFEEK